MATSSLFNQELLQFCGEHARDRFSMELLAFWGRHPHGRFTVGAITCAMDAKRLSVERALRGLVAQGLVTASVQNDKTLYYLVDNEKIRQQIVELAELNWCGRRAMVENLGCEH
ncbi:MAG TPA: hypothetical protein G4O13_02100 [Dehalococcoidia bacterium]|nr:hypothetical protein [Dehalococcoidia bacterium]